MKEFLQICRLNGFFFLRRIFVSILSYQIYANLATKQNYRYLIIEPYKTTNTLKNMQRLNIVWCGFGNDEEF